jgi:hypothetical protein
MTVRRDGKLAGTNCIVDHLSLVSFRMAAGTGFKFRFEFILPCLNVELGIRSFWDFHP